MSTIRLTLSCPTCFAWLRIFRPSDASAAAHAEHSLDARGRPVLQVYHNPLESLGSAGGWTSKGAGRSSRPSRIRRAAAVIFSQPGDGLSLLGSDQA